jgi:hypothetical protein
MRVRRFFKIIAMVVPVLVGCGGSTPAPPAEAFELQGAWAYLGPSDGPHDLAIGPGSMAYTDADGTWSSQWTVKAYDNQLHHFQIAFVSGSGTYLPVGQSLSGTYDLRDTLLTVQTTNGLSAYPPLQSPGTCTGAADGAPVPDCRLYIKQN